MGKKNPFIAIVNAAVIISLIFEPAVGTLPWSIRDWLCDEPRTNLFGTFCKIFCLVHFQG